MYVDSVLGIFAVVLSIEMLVHLASYLALRMRNQAAADPDPQLGRKFVLNLFLHYAILLIMAAFTVSVCDLVDSALFPFQQTQNAVWPGGGPGPGMWPPPTPSAPSMWNENQRIAVSLLASGLLYFLLLFMVIRFRTNSRQFPAVGRSFAMVRFTLSGIIVMATTTVFLVFLLQEGNTDFKRLAYVIGFAVVWGPFALGHLFWVLHRCDQDKKRSGADETHEPPRRVPARSDEESEEPPQPRMARPPQARRRRDEDEPDDR
jgi:hypothetical protein